MNPGRPTHAFRIQISAEGGAEAGGGAVGRRRAALLPAPLTDEVRHRRRTIAEPRIPGSLAAVLRINVRDVNQVATGERTSGRLRDILRPTWAAAEDQVV